MSRYSDLLACELELRLKHFADRVITRLTSIQKECTLAGQSAVSLIERESQSQLRIRQTIVWSLMFALEI
jgi:hypothetical protein